MDEREIGYWITRVLVNDDCYGFPSNFPKFHVASITGSRIISDISDYTMVECKEGVYRLTEKFYYWYPPYYRGLVRYLKSVGYIQISDNEWAKQLSTTIDLERLL